MKRRRFLENLAASAAGISCRQPSSRLPLVRSPSTVAPERRADREATRSGFPPGQEKRFDIRAQYD
jgi:hypothetical protein